MKHGKKQFIDFQEEELRQLRNYFSYLDKDKGGSISAEELEEPLIALGFAENRDDVQALIRTIDKNGNGEIELDEFLTIIKSGKQGGTAGPAIGNFFKEMISGGYNKGQMPIPLYISDYRRKMIIHSMIGDKQPQADTDTDKAKKITQAFVRLMESRKERSQEGEKEVDKQEEAEENGVSAAHIEELQQKLNSIFE